MRRRTRYLVGAGVGGALLVLALGLRYGPSVTLAMALAVPASQAFLGPLAHEPTRGELRLPGAGRPLDADVYRPATPRGAILLVHGLSPAGRRHPELQRLAQVLARHGQLVMVPDFEGLRTFRLGGREVDEIEQALRHLLEQSRQVGVAGFSFGAGPTLLAAARRPELRLVGSFGGYADLRHVVTFITTGVHTFEGRRYVTAPEEYNRWKLLALLVGFVEDEADRARLQPIATRKLANPAADTGALESGLGEAGRSILALVRNRREDAVDLLLARLPPGARQALERLSPGPTVARLPGRLLIAHGAEDSSIPYTESLHLAMRSGGRARAVIFDTFHHTGPRPLWDSLNARALDGWRLLRVADQLLGG
ncbi:MAG TPA: hypothetical protein VGW35_12040 [Methylomirabilota bacterium]|jgi:hypothetical protein|nr:hypothetical protein [Methylomirabilota bacterium]